MYKCNKLETGSWNELPLTICFPVSVSFDRILALTTKIVWVRFARNYLHREKYCFVETDKKLSKEISPK